MPREKSCWTNPSNAPTGPKRDRSQNANTLTGPEGALSIQKSTKPEIAKFWTSPAFLYWSKRDQKPEPRNSKKPDRFSHYATDQDLVDRTSLTGPELASPIRLGWLGKAAK